MEANGQLHDPSVLPLEERASSIPWMGGSVGRRTGLDAVAKRKNFLTFSCRESNSCCPVRS